MNQNLKIPQKKPKKPNIHKEKNQKTQKIRMKIIHCPIWNEIKVSETARLIIDTIEFQRLHYIKQTGLLYKVFPGATHTRFQHSLGVYHTSKLLLSQLEENSKETLTLSDRRKELISLIGLLHDLGHGGLSHLFDLYLEKNPDKCSIEKKHEERSCQIFRNMITKYNFHFTEEEVDFICDGIVDPKQDVWYNSIVNNPYSSFDVDKIDYLIRDSKYIGLPISFDILRILNNVILHHGQICFCENIKFEIEKMFMMRDELHQNIYRHQTVEKFQNYILEKMQEKSFMIHSLDQFLEMTDEYLLFTILTPQERREFETRTWDNFHIMERKNYKDEQKVVAMTNLKWYNRKNIYSVGNL